MVSCMSNQVNIDNNVYMDICVHMNTCHNIYDVFIKFKLSVFFFSHTKLFGSGSIDIFDQIHV